MKRNSSILKHLDFIILDIIVVELSYLLANILYAFIKNWTLTFGTVYRITAFSLAGSVIISLIIDKPFKNILKRLRYAELKQILKHTAELLIMNVMFIFFTHFGGAASRLTTAFTWIIYFVLTVITRFLLKNYLRKKLSNSSAALSAAVLFTSRIYAEEISKAIQANPLNTVSIKGIFLTDYDPARDTKETNHLPIMGGRNELLDYATHNWVDDVYLFLPGQRHLYQKLEEDCDVMGLTSHRILLELRKDDSETVTPWIQKVGNCVVATHRRREISPVQWFLKRTLDIIGGIVGCFFTLIFTIIVGPMIWFADPGPIFYGSKRVGKNGKLFTMYKFRSMYQDADARKAELMKQNKMQGYMFKVDDDPRIIGSEKKDKNGKPKGIGNFIRKTSIECNVIIRQTRKNLDITQVLPVLSNFFFSSSERFLTPNQELAAS